MLFTLLSSVALSAATPAPLVAPQIFAQQALRPGVVQKMDAHGHVATQYFDSGERPSISAQSQQFALGTADWKALGPFGGDVEALRVDPGNASVVLAGLAPSSGNGTMYRSTDGGASWTEVASLAGMSVYDIEFSGAGTAYAGTIDGIWKTTDGGATWVNLPLGIGANDQVLEITIDPSTASTLWAGVANALGNQTQTILRSTDAGASWVNRAPLGGPYSFAGIDVDPTNSGRIVAAWQGSFGGGGVFVSTNGGSTWVNRSAGLPGNPMNDVIFHGGDILLCGGQLFGSQIVGVYSTPDLGVTWTELSSAAWPNRAITDLQVDPANSSRILCTSQGSGICESTDGGANWSFGLGGSGAFSSNCITFAPSNNSEVYLGSASTAIWKSTNAGATFGPSSVGIGQLDVWSVATNPNDSSEIAIAYQGQNNGGVQSSQDGGLTWTNEALPGTRFNTVTFDPNGVLYAVSDGPTTIGAEALYRRVGSSWTSIGPDQGPQFESELVPVAFDPTDASGNTILSGGGDFGVAGFEPTIWKTTDGGANWTKVYEGPNEQEDVTAIVFPSAGSDVVVASYTDFGAGQDAGALRSGNAGASWSESNLGLNAGCQGRDLSLAPNGTEVILADGDSGAGNGGLFRSTDGGQSWSSAGVAQLTLAVVHNPSAGAELLTTHGTAPRVQSSVDGGATQGAYDTGLPSSAFMRDLYAAPGGGTYYVATVLGVFRTGDQFGTNYCGTSPNSVGAGGLISASGSNSVAANNLVLHVQSMPAKKPALFFYGAGQTSIPLGNGVRCVDAGGVGLFRYSVVLTDAGGTASLAVDYNAQTDVNGIIIGGSTWNFQCWYRDPVAPPVGYNLTDGLQVTFQL